MARLLALVAIVSILVLGTVFDHVYAAEQTTTSPTQAFQALVGRVLGSDYVDNFVPMLIPAASNGNDVFELSGGGSGVPVFVKGSSAVALASGLNWYLKYSCHAEMSWGRDGSGDQLDLPSPLPKVNPFRQVSPVKYRYAWNVCTVSYSMAWWDWQRWEREIDFNALNGVNMPLSFTGQEYIWAQVYKSFGLTEADLDAHFAGPAFLAWGRMGNIRGWGGPLGAWWRNATAALQKQILQRQRELGMYSVLPCFAGHIPGAIQRLYPQANITRSADWNKFPSPYGSDYLLEPNDPLFQKIADKFMEVQAKEFGTSEWYNCDMFNEMNPSSDDPAYLASTSAAVVKGIQNQQPQGKWLMQGWLFHSEFWTDNVSRIKAYLGGVANDAMMILDLNSIESPVFTFTESYFGKPFIFCLLLDYGGRRGMFGNINATATLPISTLQAGNTTMVGTGITPEAIENNPIMFNLMFEMGWRDSFFDVDDWVASYASRRYLCSKTPCPMALEGWSLLQHTLYTTPITESIIHHSPALTMSTSTVANATAAADVFRLFVQSANDEFNGTVVLPFSYDIVDIAREMLGNLFYDLHSIFRVEYQRYQFYEYNTTLEVQALGEALLKMINDTDAILGTNTNYLLGPWLENAKSWGSTPAEQSLLEFNARNQITLWGPTGQINDYAAKAWQGLVGTYYYSRWELFVQSLLGCVGQIPVPAKCNDDRFPVDYEKDLLVLEENWGEAHDSYPTSVTGDVLAVANDIMQTYFPSLDSYDIVQNMDVPGSDLLNGERTWTQDIQQMMFLCNADPSCAGFNSNGYLKTQVAGPRRAVTGCDLYIKKA